MASAAKSVSANGKQAVEELSIEDLSKQIEVLKADISNLASSLGDFTKSKGEELKDNAKQKVQDTVDTGREKALEAQLQAEDFVRNQPATALGIAAGLGFVIGMISSRR